MVGNGKYLQGCGFALAGGRVKVGDLVRIRFGIRMYSGLVVQLFSPSSLDWKGMMDPPMYIARILEFDGKCHYFDIHNDYQYEVLSGGT